MIFPDFNSFKELCKKTPLIPVYKEIVSDFDTPVSLFYKVREGKYNFLFESLEGGEKWGRYSFIGLNPFLIFASKDKKVFLKNKEDEEFITNDTEDPLANLKEIINSLKPNISNGLPRFFGGAVGFLGYDMVRFMERLPNTLEDNTGFFDSHFMFPRLLIVHDNLKQSLKIIYCVLTKEGDPIDLYNRAKEEIESTIKKIIKGKDYPSYANKEVSTVLLPEIPQDRFEDMVKKAKEYIKAGDVIQVVLSQRFSGKNFLDTFSIYRVLRRINPSPYLYYLNLDDECLIGSSPEILVRLTDKKIDVRPIAGTRPRGKTKEEDLALEKDLLADPKERAEHLMLVDLGRNDVGRVAKIGTVKVEDLLTVERYSHVMHLVSGVTGELEDGKDMFDVLRACFPAGTVTGAPKIRAMEIIEELEAFRRGPYAGAVGYFGFSGNMDFAITIRTLCQKKDMLYLQAGAGIVADSDPTREWQETINKGKALMRTLELLQDEEMS